MIETCNKRLPALLLLTQEGLLVAKPNVILIMTDDQGYGDMSCHRNPYLKTPNIERLYEESVRLTDFRVDPTCSPTRAALMTGRYSSRVGVWLTYGGRHHLRADEVTMADVFAAAGYHTAIFGKWHLGDNYYGMIVNIDQNVGRLRHRLAESGLADNTILIFLTDKSWGAYYVYVRRSK